MRLPSRCKSAISRTTATSTSRNGRRSFQFRCMQPRYWLSPNLGIDSESKQKIEREPIGAQIFLMLNSITPLQ